MPWASWRKNGSSCCCLLYTSNPLNETVTYKVGGTLYEVSTVCGGSELLYDKMKRLIKSETVKTPTDKEKEVRYNEDNNLFVGRSLQEE